MAKENLWLLKQQIDTTNQELFSFIDNFYEKHGDEIPIQGLLNSLLLFCVTVEAQIGMTEKQLLTFLKEAVKRAYAKNKPPSLDGPFEEWSAKHANK
jgi:hypothetical protein